MTLGSIYEVEYLDHFATPDKDSHQVVHQEPTILKSYGRFLGSNKHYIVLCWNYEAEVSECNDNMSILKKAIIKIKELK